MLWWKTNLNMTLRLISLMLGDSTLEEIKVSMPAGETREVNFSPIVPKQAVPNDIESSSIHLGEM